MYPPPASWGELWTVREMHPAVRLRKYPLQTSTRDGMAHLSPAHQRILWCLRYGIGDVVMELPLIAPLRRVAPRARLTVLGAHPAIQLLEEDPRVDGVTSLQSLGLAHRWDPGGPVAIRSIDAWLEREDFDLVLDTRHAPPAVSRRIYAAGVLRIDSDPEIERASVASGSNAVDAIRQAVTAGWGLANVEVEATPVIRVEASRANSAHRRIGELPPARVTVALAPIASLRLKRWPLERFVALADWLDRTLDARILVFCGPEDALADELRARISHSERHLFLGPLHLGSVAALLERCDLLVANDTGLAHIAAAVGTPSVGIFGPTAPRIYRPRAANARSVGGEAVPCEHRTERSLEPPGCWFTDTCLLGGEGCIHDVTPTEVQEAVREVLGYTELRESA